MLNGDIIFGIITSLIGISWIFMSRGFPAGTADGVPGPGYFPIILGVALIIMSVVLIIKGIKTKKIYFNVKEWPKENIKIFLFTILSVVIFMVLWIKVSYILASIVMLFSLGCFYKIKPMKNIIIAICFSFGTYWLFNNVFHVMLKLR